ncbi:MAG TPA: class I adenylate-forming enzyme family protein [Spirochaetia bacterium]|nr:class I adenylate-forming enzyme family protein [Spirochaetia bacterium]
MYEKKPWVKFYGIVPESLSYERVTLYEAIERTARQYPDYTAYDFLGLQATYRELLSDIDTCAAALSQRGLSKGDRVTICLPNCPQAVIMFYALNKIGAVASMIHPLSAPEEIEFYLNASNSVWAFTLDAFYGNFKVAFVSGKKDGKGWRDWGKTAAQCRRKGLEEQVSREEGIEKPLVLF